MSSNVHRSCGMPISVPARCLSGFIEGDVDLLKLDVEGAETRVLQDLAKSGKLVSIRQMVLEYHHNLPGERPDMSSFLRILEENQFRYQILTFGALEAVPEGFQDLMIYACRSHVG